MIVLLALCAGAPGASAQPLKLTPARVQLFAEQASVIRGLLGIEDSLTYDAVALKPRRGRLALRIRVQNRVLISLCNAIIRDNNEISRAESELRRARTGPAGFDSAVLIKQVSSASADVASKLEAMTQKGDSISVADMFEMQLLMNQISQLTGMATSITSASNSAIASLARNVKS